MSYETETLIRWMVRNGFQTGHHDNINDLLAELWWQIEEMKTRIVELQRDKAA